MKSILKKIVSWKYIKDNRIMKVYDNFSLTGTIKAMLSGPGQFAENETNEVWAKEGFWKIIVPNPLGARWTLGKSQAMCCRRSACTSLTKPGYKDSHSYWILAREFFSLFQPPTNTDHTGTTIWITTLTSGTPIRRQRSQSSQFPPRSPWSCSWPPTSSTAEREFCGWTWPPNFHLNQWLSQSHVERLDWTLSTFNWTIDKYLRIFKFLKLKQ